MESAMDSGRALCPHTRCIPALPAMENIVYRGNFHRHDTAATPRSQRTASTPARQHPWHRHQQRPAATAVPAAPTPANTQPSSPSELPFFAPNQLHLQVPHRPAQAVALISIQGAPEVMVGGAGSSAPRGSAPQSQPQQGELSTRQELGASQLPQQPHQLPVAAAGRGPGSWGWGSAEQQLPGLLLSVRVQLCLCLCLRLHADLPAPGHAATLPCAVCTLALPRESSCLGNCRLEPSETHRCCCCSNAGFVSPDLAANRSRL